MASNWQLQGALALKRGIPYVVLGHAETQRPVALPQQCREIAIAKHKGVSVDVVEPFNRDRPGVERLSKRDLARTKLSECCPGRKEQGGERKASCLFG